MLRSERNPRAFEVPKLGSERFGFDKIRAGPSSVSLLVKWKGDKTGELHFAVCRKWSTEHKKVQILAERTGVVTDTFDPITKWWQLCQNRGELQTTLYVMEKASWIWLSRIELWESGSSWNPAFGPNLRMAPGNSIRQEFALIPKLTKKCWRNALFKIQVLKEFYSVLFVRIKRIKRDPPVLGVNGGPCLWRRNVTIASRIIFSGILVDNCIILNGTLGLFFLPWGPIFWTFAIGFANARTRRFLQVFANSLTNTPENLEKKRSLEPARSLVHIRPCTSSHPLPTTKNYNAQMQLLTWFKDKRPPDSAFYLGFCVWIYRIESADAVQTGFFQGETASFKRPH